MTRRGLILFLSMAIIWGIPYLFIRIAVAEISPPTLVFLRTTVATAILLPARALAHRPAGGARPLALGGGVRRDRDRHPVGPPRLGGAAPLELADRAPDRQHPADRHGVRRRDRRHRPPGPDAACWACSSGSPASSPSSAATSRHGPAGRRAGALVTAVCYAIGPAILARRLGGVPSLGIMALSLAGVALLYAPARGAPVARRARRRPTRSCRSLVLGTICTAAAFILFAALIGEIGPVRVDRDHVHQPGGGRDPRRRGAAGDVHAGDGPRARARDPRLRARDPAAGADRRRAPGPPRSRLAIPTLAEPSRGALASRTRGAPRGRRRRTRTCTSSAPSAPPPSGWTTVGVRSRSARSVPLGWRCHTVGNCRGSSLTSITQSAMRRMIEHPFDYWARARNRASGPTISALSPASTIVSGAGLISTWSPRWRATMRESVAPCARSPTRRPTRRRPEAQVDRRDIGREADEVERAGEVDRVGDPRRHLVVGVHDAAGPDPAQDLAVELARRPGEDRPWRRIARGSWSRGSWPTGRSRRRPRRSRPARRPGPRPRRSRPSRTPG